MINRTQSFFNEADRHILRQPVFGFLLAVVVLMASAACRSEEPVGAPTNTTLTPASSANAAKQQDAPAADAVRVEAEQVTLAPGESAEAIVRLVIAKPLHVNANPATRSFLIPTQLSLRSAKSEGITAGAPRYPEAVERKFASDESPLRIYEGTAEIRLPLTAARDAASGARAIPLRVRVQPCADEVCYPPRTLEATIPVIIP